MHVGFKGSRKSTPFAAQMAAEAAGRRAMDHGMKKIDVFVKGPGSGRETAIRSLGAIGLDFLAAFFRVCLAQIVDRRAMASDPWPYSPRHPVCEVNGFIGWQPPKNPQ